MATAFPHASLRGTPLARVACATGAFTVTAVMAAGLLGLFHQASPTSWLTPTPALLARASACDTLDDRAARRHCWQAAVVAERRRLAEEADTRVAMRP